MIALDVLPTAVALAGGKSPADCDGVDLMPHLLGEKNTPPHASLYWRHGPQRAVRRGHWKLVDWRDLVEKQNSGWQLYDLSKDIGEQQDLASAYPELVIELSKEWEVWNTKNIAPLWHGTPQDDPTAPAKPALKPAAKKK